MSSAGPSSSSSRQRARDDENERNKASYQRKAAETGTNGGPSKLELMQQALLTKLGHRRSESTKILSDLAPVMMTPRMVNAASTVNSRSRTLTGKSSSLRSSGAMDFATVGRTPLRLGLGSRRITSRDLQIAEAAEELLQSDVPDASPVEGFSLLRGFNATIPSAEQGKTRRRQMRAVDTPKLGLKTLGQNARGLLTEEGEHHSEDEEMVIVPRRNKGKRKGRESLATAKMLGKDELTRQTQEIMRDKENLHVKRSLIHSEIAEITNKIQSLDGIRSKLEHDLLKLQEDELELEDELEGVAERLRFEQSHQKPQSAASTAKIHIPQTTRRRKGPSFLPSEHDDLPPGVAFMTLEHHTTPIIALDFSEPYGTLVTAAEHETQPRVFDLFNGVEIGQLRGHVGAVRAMQVEDHVCLTGSEDGTVRLWDLRRIDEDDGTSVNGSGRAASEGWDEGEGEMVSLSDIAEDSEAGSPQMNGRETTSSNSDAPAGPCVRVLEGHSQSVTALYFEDECLVTGASDKTLRQWDLQTGQCVMTMDILWAMSHGQSSYLPDAMFSAGPSTDFVGGVQFWGYGLVSGSADSAVRMWDMRTGQCHRTLLGHTGPVSCLQFDELHIVSGSHDRTVRIWDLRAGGVLETLQYDAPVTALQFDTRKVVTAAGDNGVKIYNRTSGQYSTLMTNGHTQPVERLRYMDRYLVSGGRDATVKVWSL